MFEKGRLYRRDELHREYGSSTPVQRQGGILTPRGQPFLLIVSGEEGRQYGYFDEWDADGVFHYYGAGQEGDMKFVRGNRSLRDHAENSKDVYLFDVEADGRLRYRGQMVYAGYVEKSNVPDGRGNARRAIIFRLVPFEEAGADGATNKPMLSARRPRSRDRRWSLPLADLRQRSSRTIGKQPKAREGKRRVWERSEDLKVYVRRRGDGRCEGCANQAPFIANDGHPYLEPHHVRRLTDGGPDDFHHVIALCPACHRRVHHGRDGDKFNEGLKTKLRALEAT